MLIVIPFYIKYYILNSIIFHNVTITFELRVSGCHLDRTETEQTQYLHYVSKLHQFCKMQSPNYPLIPFYIKLHPILFYRVSDPI